VSEQKCANCGHERSLHFPEDEGCRQSISLLPLRKCPCRFYVPASPKAHEGEAAQEHPEDCEISTVVLGEGRISVGAARGADGLHAIVMQPLDQPRTVGENLLPTDGLHYLPLNRDTLRIVITHPDAAQVVIEAASAIQRVLRGATMEEVAKDYARSIRPLVNPTKHETDGVTEFPPNTFCMPNYDGKQVPQWLLFFEDRDRGYSTFDNEADAREAFDHAKDHWNCTLFEPVRQQPSTPQTPIDCCRGSAPAHECYVNCGGTKPNPTPPGGEQPLMRLGFDAWYSDSGLKLLPELQKELRGASWQAWKAAIERNSVNYAQFEKVCDELETAEAEAAALRAQVEELERAHEINLKSFAIECPEEVWGESCGTRHIAIRIMRQRLEQAQDHIAELEGK
jgi:hypothetical protein